MSRPESTMMDINGDGLTDHLTSRDDGSMTVVLNNTGKTNLLKSVNRPLGASFTLRYIRDGNTYNMPQSKWVLSRVELFDGFGGDGVDDQLLTFQYLNPKHNRYEREFNGYETVITEQRDGGSNTLYRKITKRYYNDSYYRKGLVRSELTQDAGNRKFSETKYTYRLIDLSTNANLVDLKNPIATVFPQVIRSDKLFYEGQASPGKTTYTTHRFDKYGNVTRFFDAGDTGAADDIRADITYTTDTANYIVGLPKTIIVSSGGVRLRKREAVYEAVTGNLTKVRAFLATVPIETDIAYYNNGNIKTVTGPANYKGERYRIDYQFDTNVETHVINIKDSFGYTSTAQYNFKYGVVEVTKDLNNNNMRTVYDKFGRVVSIFGPYEFGTSTPTLTFNYYHDAITPWALTKHLDKYRSTIDPIETVLFIDGLKRVLQTKKDATIRSGTTTKNVMIVSGKATYDGVGRVIEQRYPVVEPTGNQGTFNGNVDTVVPTKTTYDVLDLVLKTVIPDSTVTTMAYGFANDRLGARQFMTQVTDANGNSKSSYTDVRGLITSVREPGNIQTSYRYDAMKQIIEVRDTRNNLTKTSYDDLGRRLTLENPDMGKHEFFYDLASNLIKKKTSNLKGRTTPTSPLGTPTGGGTGGTGTGTGGTGTGGTGGTTGTGGTGGTTGTGGTGGTTGTGSTTTGTAGAPLGYGSGNGPSTSTGGTTGTGTGTGSTGPLGSNPSPTGTPVTNAITQERAILYEYDYNRLARIKYPDFPYNNVTYTYGAMGAANNRSGRIAQVQHQSGIDRYFYGKLGEVVRETKSFNTNIGDPKQFFNAMAWQQTGPYKVVADPSIQIETYTTQYEFDSWGRLQKLTFDDGEVLTYQYDSGGLLKSSSGNYIKKIHYDKFAQRSYILYGNGVETKYTYNTLNRRLTTLKAGKGGQLFQNLKYTFDKVGNILKKENLVATPTVNNTFWGPVSQSYTYDNLYRMTSSTGTYEFFDQDRKWRSDYTLTMSYDNIHNILSKIQKHDITDLGGTGPVGTKPIGNNPLGYTGQGQGTPQTGGTTPTGKDPLGYNKGPQGGTGGTGTTGNQPLGSPRSSEGVKKKEEALLKRDKKPKPLKKEEPLNHLDFDKKVSPPFIPLEKDKGEPSKEDAIEPKDPIKKGTPETKEKVENLFDKPLAFRREKPGQTPPLGYGQGNPSGGTGGTGTGTGGTGTGGTGTGTGGTGTASTVIPQTRTTYSWMYRYAARPHAPVKIGERTFLYDANGNQTGWKDKYNNTHRTIVWDEENRIQFIKDRAGASAAGPSGGSGGAPKVHAYKYDHTGQRRVKRSGTGWTVYVNQFYTVRNGQIPTKFIFAGSTRIAAKVRTQDQLGNKTDKVYYYHPDHLGSTNYITDTSGKIHEHTEYFPFGESWASESQNTQANPKLIPYLFTGKELDVETQLYYYGARYYDPRTSVWQSPDPVLNDYLDGSGNGGLYYSLNSNLYAYTYQNPIKYTDPDGKNPLWLWEEGVESAAKIANGIAKSRATKFVIRNAPAVWEFIVTTPKGAWRVAKYHGKFIGGQIANGARGLYNYGRQGYNYARKGLSNGINKTKKVIETVKSNVNVTSKINPKNGLKTKQLRIGRKPHLRIETHPERGLQKPWHRTYHNSKGVETTKRLNPWNKGWDKFPNRGRQPNVPNRSYRLKDIKDNLFKRRK